MFTSIGTLIKTLPKHSRVPESIVALHVRRAFVEGLNKVCSDLPQSALAGVKPLVFKQGTLTVSARGLAFVELSMRSSAIIYEVNGILGKKVLKKINFRGY